MRTRLEEYGIMRGSGHEAFRGCVIIPLTAFDSVTGIYGQRLERGHAAVWAEGFTNAGFEVTSGVASNPSRVLVTSSVSDAISVLGALEDLKESSVVIAPGRKNGFSTKDLRYLATRHADVVVLGRGTDELPQKLVALGARVTRAGSDCDLATTIVSALNPSKVITALLPEATRPEAETTEVPVLSNPALPPTVTSTNGRDEVFVHFNERSWRFRGARARGNVEGDRLSVALSVSEVASGRFHLDTLDLYVARQRASFLETAASELGADRTHVGVEMIEVLTQAERARDEAPGRTDAPDITMSEKDRDEALAWLEDPRLFDHVTEDLARLGVVGESTNLLLCYLATISRKCERPVGVLVQSSSAGGKSTLVEAVCSLVPHEDLVSLSALTSQALYYLGGNGLRHKVLSVAEEHGSLRASYALKLLLSEGRLAIATTEKDRTKGRLVTKNYETAGPLALLMTTTATSIDPELENRLVVVGVDEDRSQTEAIIEAQRRSISLEGFLARDERAALRRRHANAQRLLQSLPVVVGAFDAPFPASSTRHRRDHAKLLSMISAVTLLHQFQRERKTVIVGDETVTYIEATREDIERGVALARHVLIRGTELLAPQTARLLKAVRDDVTTRSSRLGCEPFEVDVTRRELREHLGWSDPQVRSATDRLVALEYLVVAGGGRGRCRTYRLVPEFADLRSSDPRTSETSSPGGTDEFVEFVGFGDEVTRNEVTRASYEKMEVHS